MKKQIVVKSFNTDKQMLEWISDPANIDSVKEQYPPTKYDGDIDLINKQIIVTKR